MKKLFMCFLLLLAFSGCKEFETTEKEQLQAVTVAEMPAALTDDAKEHYDAAPQNQGYPDQKIIKNANLRFETDDLDVSAKTINAAVVKYKAQVQNESEGKQDYEFNRVMTVRVPSQHFEAFIADISKGVNYFDTKEISSTDVTEEYIDTEARIKAKKVLEARYLELISKAQKVSEILEIEKELSAIREEIESKEGQLRYMKSRVAMSTVHINFYKKTAEHEGATVSYGSKMWNAIASGFNGVSSFFIGLLNMWPLILIFVIGYIVIRKKLKKKNRDYDKRI